jgi:[ribosomal protein S18]-alanine N-acetyltransferase
VPPYSSVLLSASKYSPFIVYRGNVLLPINVNTLNLELRTLTEEHLSAALDLDRACFGGLWTLEAYQREIDSPNSDLVGLFSPISPTDLLAMGCFWSILEEAHITILAVHPEYQHQGLGQALLYSLLQTASSVGLERATLEVRASNQGAINLYQKFGFKTAGRRRRYYQDNGEDALVLWLGNLQQADFQQDSEIWYRMVCDRLKKSGWLFTIS